MKATLRLLAALMPLLLASNAALAQFTLRGTLGGLVTDSSQAVVQGADVTLLDLDRNQTTSTKTNAEGLYSFTNLTPGRYQVSVEFAGFKRAVSDTVTLATQQNLRIDLALEPGGITETVEVKAGAAPLIQTEQSVVGQVVDRDMVASLPALGRNFTAFAALAPNISTFPRGNYGDTWSVGGFHSIGGVNYVAGGGGDNGFYMNGVNINDNWVGSTSYAPSIEAISEVKVDVANFSAANGRDISTFQVSTRGGTNALHGTAFDYFQNSGLNAWNPYTKIMSEPGQKKDVLQRNQFGGNLGGPVILPKIFNGKDKAFFFVNYEGTRENRGGASALYRVPTEAERQGDFSELLSRFPGDPNYVLYDPWSTVIDADGNSIRTAVPNNDLRNITRPDGSPAINADAQAMLAMFPMPNGYSNPVNPGDLNNYRTFAARGHKSYRLDVRGDVRLSDNDSVYVNVSRSRGLDNNTGGLIPELNANVEDLSHLVTANYARVFSPTLTNEFIFGIGKGTLFNADQGVRDYMHRTDTLRNKFFKNIGSGEDLGYHSIDFWSNGWPWSIGMGEVFMASNPTLQFSDNVSWIKGAHSFKFGFNFFRKEETDWDYIRTVAFSDQFTRSGSVDESRGGDAMASFLLGLPSGINQRFAFSGGDPQLNMVIPYWGFYGEDKWQLSPKLTVSLGLRYDLSVPPYSGDRYGNAIMDFGYPGWQLMIPGRTPGVPLHYVPADKNNLAPRISVAYQPWNSLVFRASYGIFYMSGTTTSLSVLNNASGAVPGYTGDWWDNARLGQHDDVPVLGFGDIFPTPTQIDVIGTYPISTGEATGYFDYPIDIRIQDKKSGVTPYYQRYMFDVQKGLGQNMSLTLTYLGGRGTKLPYYENVNMPAYQTGWTSSEAYNAARPNATGRWGDVRLLRHGLNSFYNGATVKLQGNLTRGLQFVTHYTYSKTVTDSQEFLPESLGMALPMWDWHRNLGRGEAEFSHPHRFVSALTFTTPWGRNMHWLGRSALWGWNISAITTFESGNALTVWNGVTDARDYEPNMVNVSGNPNLSRGDRSFSRYFDTSVFSAPAQDVKGNAGRGIVRGPGVNNWDISLSKTFRPVERLGIEFRGDLLNAFNHTQWAGVDTTYTDSSESTFGWVTWAREGRIVQLGLRMTF
ncbi:MAG: carboxypeptidase regulatory-like domain-containing protein [Acidobacteriota bacterium]